MGKELDILFDIIKIWADENELYSKQCTVKSINGRSCDVTPVDGGSDILDVSLEADITDEDSKGFFIVPKVGSLVVVTFTTPTDAFISAYTQIDTVVAKQGEWVFNDGSNGGLTITPELKTQLDKNNELLQALIDIISGSPITEAGNGAPSALQIALSAAITGKSLGDFDNIENELVKH